MKTAKPEYLEKVQTLSDEEKERLLSRMAGKLPRKLEKDKLSMEEAMAIQLEIEDEQLEEWRLRMRHIRARDLAKAEKKANAEAEEPAKPKKTKAENAKS